MSVLSRKIAQRIASEGPLPFSIFMEMALYDPDHGYYRADPFGKDGDFYTASQLQPVFGAYVRAMAAMLDPDFTAFTDIGAGREDLRASFNDRNYRAIHRGQKIPKTKSAILFSNELFDALPVDLFEDGKLLRVGCGDGEDGKNFVWHPSAPLAGVREVRPSSRLYLEQAWHSIDTGFFIVIDYGYRHTEEGSGRFPQGSLMSYRRHVAVDDVLKDPGTQDITAHVDWDALMDEARSSGWQLRSFSSMRASLLALGADTLEMLNSLGKMQFRTLFFSMGESFDVLVLQKK